MQSPLPEPAQTARPPAAPTPQSTLALELPSVAIPTPANQPTSAPAIAQITPTLTTTPYLSPPDVVFTQVTAGKTHACGLRENGAIACWGNNNEDKATPPQGSFSQISAGLNFTCGLRQDATIACWGDNSAGKATPPQGSFTEISAGNNHACAIPLPQDSPPALLCWGRPFPNGAETLPLDAPLSRIQSRSSRTCGLTPQSDMACLLMNNRLAEITPGPFTQLAVGLTHVCALREDASAFCQGQNDSMQASPPPTKFTQIAAGWMYSCGITRASLIECWGSGRSGAPGERLAAPDGEFIAIAGGWRNSCALRPNGRAVCWRTPRFLPLNNPPDGVSLAFGGAEFDAPIELFPWPNGGIALVEREGVIAAHYDHPDAPPPQTILDMTDAVACCQGESGMLSAALDPQFQDFPFLYVWYRTISDNVFGEGAPGFAGRLSRFRVNHGVAIRGSELVVIEVDQPIYVHLGGAIRFGADGMLYLGIGDNRTPDDSQPLNNLRGKIIRIDVRGATADQPYRIPPDNPFVDNPDARPEIWARGLRNPWRMAFDPQNPANLFVADVGFKIWEEVSIATAGANLGWSLCEANSCKDWGAPEIIANLTPPAIAYGREVGCAIIGGITVPWMDDGFIFSDLCARRVWLLERDSPPQSPDSASDDTQETTQDEPQAWRMREIIDLSPSMHHIVAFGAGADGSVYALPLAGPILRLHPDLVK